MPAQPAQASCFPGGAALPRRRLSIGGGLRATRVSIIVQNLITPKMHLMFNGGLASHFSLGRRERNPA